MNVRDFELEQLALNELDEPRATEVKALLQTDPALAARYQAVLDSNRDILQALPSRAVAAEVHRRAEAAKAPRRPFAFGLAAAALAAVVLAMVLAPRIGGVTTDESDTVRIKGLQPSLRLFRLRGDGGIEELASGARARAGDEVQVRYVPAGARYGVVLSIDGHASVTVHFPPTPEGSTSLANESTWLPRAFELDDAPRFERFILLACDAPPDVAAVTAAAQALAKKPDALTAALIAPGACGNQSSFVLVKEPLP